MKYDITKPACWTKICGAYTKSLARTKMTKVAGANENDEVAGANEI